MALQAQQILGACRQLSDGDELARVALPMLLYVILGDGFARWTVTGLTVDQGQFGALDLQLPMNALVQESGIFIMGVACRETGLVTDIIGKQGADKHLFVLSHGNNGSAGF